MIEARDGSLEDAIQLEGEEEGECQEIAEDDKLAGIEVLKNCTQRDVGASHAHGTVAATTDTRGRGCSAGHHEGDLRASAKAMAHAKGQLATRRTSFSLFIELFFCSALCSWLTRARALCVLLSVPSQHSPLALAAATTDAVPSVRRAV